MMIAAEKEDVAEESIKNTLFLPTSVDLTFPAKWSRMSSPMTEVGLRWKSSKRQESIEVNASERKKNISNAFCSSFPTVTLWTQIPFFVLFFQSSFSSPTLICWAQLPLIFLQKVGSAYAVSPMPTSSSSPPSLSSLSSSFWLHLLQFWL